MARVKGRWPGQLNRSASYREATTTIYFALSIACDSTAARGGAATVTVLEPRRDETHQLRNERRDARRNPPE